ncbi:MAG: nitroreductase [Oscillospiraceae bacterium]|nr:nitroreductase [Oscillospiraceae bacterium]
MAELIKNDVINAIMERRSVRGYTSEPLTEDELYTLLQCGLWAPSGRNDQTTMFSVVQDDELMQRLHNEALGDAPFKCFYYGAPCVIFLFDKAGNKWSVANASLAIENMHIAAHSLGLASIILGCIKDYMLSEKGEEWKKILGIPEDYDFVLALAVGHPTDDGKVFPRDEKNIVYVK